MVGQGLANIIGNTITGGGPAVGGGGATFENLYSCEFNGIDMYIDCGSYTGFDSLTTASISCWFYTDSSGNNYLCSQWGTTTGEQSFALYVKPSSNQVDVYFSTNVSYRSNSIPINTGQWHHIVATFDGSNTNAKERVKVYLDGVQYVQSVWSGPTGTKAGVTSSFFMGLRGGFTFNGLEGELDEVSLWTVELSQSDVTAIYNSGTPTDLSSSGISGLINWWRNGDPTGTAAYPTIVDQVGSNNGTMTNMTDTQIVTSVP